jgi:hypothetical protein
MARTAIRLRRKGYMPVRTSRPSAENGDRMFLDAKTTGESIRAIVLPRDRCLFHKKETYE